MTEPVTVPVASLAPAVPKPSLLAKLRSLRWVDHAARDLHRLWSIRIALAYAVFTGMAMVLAAFVDVLNPWFLLGVSEVVCVAIVVLRLIKQKEPAAAEAMEPVA